MNIEINPDYEKSTTLRALSAFLTLLADEAEGETKDGLILSAIVQKGLNHVEQDAPVVKVGGEEVEAAFEGTKLTLAEAPKEAPKRTRRTKAEMVAENPTVAPDAAKSEPQSGAEEGTASVVSTAGPRADLTIDDVRAALQRYTAVHGMPDGIALLKNYGAGRISELGVEQYPLFIAECDAAEAA